MSAGSAIRGAGAGKRDPQTHAVIGAAMEVHRQLGSGFLEAVYQEALAIEMKRQGISFQREVELPIRYKGRVLGCTYRPDFICYEALIVELKSINELGRIEQSQVINYLKASGLERAVLLNFGASSLEYKRLILSSNLRESAQSAVTSATSLPRE